MGGASIGWHWEEGPDVQVAPLGIYCGAANSQVYQIQARLLAVVLCTDITAPSGSLLACCCWRHPELDMHQ